MVVWAHPQSASLRCGVTTANLHRVGPWEGLEGLEGLQR